MYGPLPWTFVFGENYKKKKKKIKEIKNGFFENPFIKDKSVGPKEIPCAKKYLKSALVVEQKSTYHISSYSFLGNLFFSEFRNCSQFK